jgi:preprotein translocase subunit SecE
MMNDVVKNTNINDYAKWGIAVLILVVGIIANQHYASMSPVIRSIGWVVFAIALVGIAMTTKQGRQAVKYLKASHAEVKKVVWPTRQTTLQILLVVAVMVIVVALIAFIFDQVFSWLISWLLGQRG